MGIGSRTVGAATAFLLLFAPMVVDAGHAPFTAQFSPKPGNEWWVEVDVTANHGLAGVDARVDGGAWTALAKQSWGSWAKSFFVETGSTVEFRARATNGESVQSGGYIWPSAEPADEPGSFEAMFSPKPGNEWWVETDVAANKPLAGVDARVDGGAWRTLDKKSWGSWAKSFFVPSGSTVEFRARATSGETEISGRYEWPSAKPLDTPEGTFDAAFAPKAGNEWWVEVLVTGDEPVAAVEARLDGGPWHALEKQSWGAWAASFHVPNGIIVTFRAHSAQGDTDLSMGYKWPDATPVDGGGFDAIFRPKAGNEWWVEVFITSTPRPVMVHAQVNDRVLHEMSGSSWGAHVLSTHVPAGSNVQFQAMTADGRVDHSAHYRWPDAQRLDRDPEPWPQEGSYAHYRVQWGAPSSVAAPHTSTDTVFIYQDGAWTVECTGATTNTATEPDTVEPYRAHASFAPPMGPVLDMQRGFEVNPEIVRDCAADNYELTATGFDTQETRNNGRPTRTVTWEGEWTADCRCIRESAAWDSTTGLVLAWHHAGSAYMEDGILLDTDAPVG